MDNGWRSYLEPVSLVDTLTTVLAAHVYNAILDVPDQSRGTSPCTVFLDAECG